ncbi:NAD-dependent epimerase [Bacteroides ovatus]|uniref:NAD-dependent epimerase n=1 Tax=Bacteroides ovatus TaxID=28116 RepID=UPI001899B394|nr:NAD-dependent epimerase [Bacteroides ovatus]MDC2625224.1 NAD-dependent epimerase [Bacteroides ovatus]MDC2639116.1 NAD-dependent epimerase [Bacteroides ovatus]MDC2652595.1 NAD-dependent epimerase [Bacteroides ovatus]
MKVLVTGAAGFIGSRLAFMLAKRGDEVVGIDSINNYYDPRLKYSRLEECGISHEGIGEFAWYQPIQSSVFGNYQFIRMSIDEKDMMNSLFQREHFDKVVNLAAQAGVRYSITNPYAYLQSNLVGFLNLLEACRHNEVKQLVFASSSSVYGLNEKVPFEEADLVDTPVSLYAATKKSNELMAHSYSKLYGLFTCGLRYFTVYGPYGRPDMAPMLFAKAILNGEPIKVFNNGDMQRDFTYIDDIVEGTIRVLDYMPDIDKCKNCVPYEIFNIGCSQPMKLMDFINEIETAVGHKAEKIYLPMQQGDVYQTYASTKKLEERVGYKPSVSLHEGILRFMEWYKSDKNPLK